MFKNTFHIQKATFELLRSESERHKRSLASPGRSDQPRKLQLLAPNAKIMGARQLGAKKELGAEIKCGSFNKQQKKGAKKTNGRMNQNDAGPNPKCVSGTQDSEIYIVINCSRIS
jgi:hypothetical protein